MNIIGQKFNRLTVLALHHKKRYFKNNKVYRVANYWLCQCECGNYRVVSTENLKSNSVKSCGCLKKLPYASIHKLSNTRLYTVWCGMKARCYNKNNPRYKDYGGRGIKVCDEWLKDFLNFYDWSMANGYQDDLTIDRIDNDFNYCPHNCRWANMKIQSNNRRSNNYITYDDEVLSLSSWGEKFSINPNLIKARLKRGWSFVDAVSIDPNIYKKRAEKLICYQGEYKTKKEWLKILGVHPSTFYRRLKKQTKLIT